MRVKWINELVDANGNYLPHLLPVDPTLHWANPPGGTMGRDTRPTFTARRAAIPARCRSSRTSTVQSVWATRATATPKPGSCLRRKDIPAWLCDDGHLVRLLRRQGCCQGFGAAAGDRGFAVLPVPQHAARLHHLVPRPLAGHDASQRLCRSGGFFIIRGGPAGDGAVLDSRTGTVAVLPGPAPKDGDELPG